MEAGSAPSRSSQRGHMGSSRPCITLAKQQVPEHTTMGLHWLDGTQGRGPLSGSGAGAAEVGGG